MVTKNFLATGEKSDGLQETEMAGFNSEPQEKDTLHKKDLEQAQAEIKSLRSQVMVLTNRLTVLEIATQENKRRFTEHVKKGPH